MKTYGYDYCYALSIAEVNKILTAEMAGMDLEIAYSTVDPDSGSTIKITGKLSPWQIVKGGSNKLINFNVPIAQGFLSLEGGAITGSYDLSNVTVEVQMNLGWMGPGSPQSVHGSGNQTTLVFSPTNGSDPDTPGYVAAINLFDPDKNLDTIATGILKSFIAAAFYDNKDKLQFIFSNVNPAPPNVSSWLKPLQWDYFYTQTNVGTDVLCFLCLLSNKPFPMQPAFDSTALSANTNSVILISQEMFFDNVVLPAVKKAFPSGSFANSVSNEVCKISNNGDFNVGTAKGSITANSFALTTSNQGNGLSISTSGGGPLKFFFGLGNLPNASYSWSVATVNPLRYNNGLISFDNDPQPVLAHNQTIHWYDWIILVALGITNIASLVSLIVDSVNDFSDQLQNVGISNVNQQVQIASGGSVVNLKTLIQWSSGGETYVATDAGLNGAFYTHGNLS
ncbi:MAG TPA: TULIP family P47-like protein [Haliscomenobacter sp.]|uniref:TULIP family P47-like protein n=1 Tax=Haliscomenobacter sp. TaxID=2717303 RepID=UPI002BBECFB9|nr:TULIP family P47-like protein [Haliscomenobacter sp.]HOY18416.1 TULIP family P47-like protein [Haliscomenobacter sp.]